MIITPLDGLLLRAEGSNHLLLIISARKGKHPAECRLVSLLETARKLELPCQQFMLN